MFLVFSPLPIAKISLISKYLKKRFEDNATLILIMFKDLNELGMRIVIIILFTNIKLLLELD